MPSHPGPVVIITFNDPARGIDVKYGCVKGVLIIGLTAMIPILGSIASLAVFIIALGTDLATRFGTLHEKSAVSGSSGTQD